MLKMILLAISLALGLSACNNGGNGNSTAVAVTATVDSAGGTVTGPDGVQVVIPAGALNQPTVIGIARRSAGAPADVPTDNKLAGRIYEFTPHDLVFNTPVTILLAWMQAETLSLYGFYGTV